MSGFLGSGDLYIDRLTAAGASTGYQDPVNAQMLQITEKTDVLKIISKMRSTRGQVLETAANKTPATIKLVLDQMDADKLAMALLGTLSTVAETGGTIASGTPSTLTLIPGRWVEIGHTNITPHVAETSPIVIATTAQTPAPVALADVEINHREGLIKYIGTTLVAATAVTMTYKYGAEDGYDIAGSTQPTIKARLRLDGINGLNDAPVRVLIDRAVLTPSAPVDFLSDKLMTLEMSGELQTLTGKTAPYTVRLRNA